VTFFHIGDILKGGFDGKSVDIQGWVYRKRDSKNMIFLVIRDSTGVIQCTVKKDSDGWCSAEKLSIESSLTLLGVVRKDERAPGGFEISVVDIGIVGLAENFPISKDKSEGFLRDKRHLWLRSRRMSLIMRIRDAVMQFSREFFRSEEFVEVSPPMFITSACEGGSTLFSLKYFDQDMYLTQSSQLYLEILIYSLEKVYCIAPSFRAEKSRTIRHLTEYWHMEGEWPFVDMGDLIRFEEGLVGHVCRRTVEQCSEELKELGVNVDKFTNIALPFPKITYTKAIEMLNVKGFKKEWGEDLGFEEEKALAEEFGKPFFVYDYPAAIKAFYCKTYRDHPEIAMSTDMLVPRIGEISTGGAREDDLEVLIKRIKDMGMKVEDYDWYVDLRRYGTVPHVGFGMGLERLLTWMLDLENIIDAVPFPRTTRRFYP
jgi:asparaginyl-tRNA synthetase